MKPKGVKKKRKKESSGSVGHIELDMNASEETCVPERDPYIHSHFIHS